MSNLVQGADARGIARTYTYDALNRVKTLSTGTASETVNYAYDETNTLTGCASSYPLGRLTRVVEQAVTTTYCYDALGRVIQKRQTQGTQTDTLGYAYTPAGRLSTLMQPSGTQVSYSRNSIGQVTAISMTTARGFKSTLASNITYLPFGPLASYTLGNGQTITRAYDANYQLTDLTSPALTLRYTRNATGTITGITVGTGTAALYFYDPLNRLTSTKDANGSLLESYTYNQTGDRLSKTGGGTSTGTYGYQANTHRLTTVGNDTRSYDAAGNTIGSVAAAETWGYVYDGYHRMITVQRGGRTAATYTYNAFGERIAKVVTVPQAVNQRFVYNEAGQLVAEYGTDSYGSTNTNRDYVWLDTLPIAILNPGDNATVINYVTADGLDTPRVVTSSTGTIIWNWPIKGNPFGDKTPAAISGYAYNLRFAGQYFDAESGLNYNVHRYYASGTGRYRQVDPIGFAGGQWSLYGYVDGNPTSYMDPTGEFGIAGSIYGGIAGGIGGYISGGWQGAVLGAGAGAVVGFINPFAANVVGASLGAGAASLLGQAAGNAIAGKDVGDLCNYDLWAAGGAALGGAIGGPANHVVGKLIDPIRGAVIGSGVGAQTLNYVPGYTIGAITEGASVGAGELGGAKVGQRYPKCGCNN